MAISKSEYITVTFNRGTQINVDRFMGLTDLELLTLAQNIHNVRGAKGNGAYDRLSCDDLFSYRNTQLRYQKANESGQFPLTVHTSIYYQIDITGD
jgi:hypothetical protein